MKTAASSSSASSKKDILENKWTTVVKLKKQVMELEKQNKQLKDNSICERCGGGLGFGNAGNGRVGQTGD